MTSEPRSQQSLYSGNQTRRRFAPRKSNPISESSTGAETCSVESSKRKRFLEGAVKKATPCLTHKSK